MTMCGDRMQFMSDTGPGVRPRRTMHERGRAAACGKLDAVQSTKDACPKLSETNVETGTGEAQAGERLGTA